MKEPPLKPPRALDADDLPTPADFDDGDGPCDCEQEGQPIPGILWWPEREACEARIQKVEACNACDRYGDDESAARVVAAAFGLQAVFLEDRPWDLEEDDLGNGYGCFGVVNPAIAPCPDPVRYTTDAPRNRGIFGRSIRELGIRGYRHYLEVVEARKRVALKRVLRKKGVPHDVNDSTIALVGLARLATGARTPPGPCRHRILPGSVAVVQTGMPELSMLCARCGVIGSFVLEPGEVDWHDEPADETG